MVAPAFQSFSSSNPVQKRLYQCHIGVVTYVYMCISVSQSRSGAKEASGAYDHLGELDQALFMYLDHGSSHGGTQQQEQRRK